MNNASPQKPETATAAGSATPAMAQFLALKADHPDALLFYRMGDFYELFFDDAVTASKTLGITLTRRGKHGGDDIPMCGVPVHAAEDYLQKLIAAGHRVAVCEQMENPAEAKKRGHKAVVRRDVVRLVTPGTITEDTLLDAGQNSFLAAIARDGGEDASRYALSWCDLSTGEFSVQMTSANDLPGDFARISPSEVLVPEGLVSDPALVEASEALSLTATILPNIEFDSISATERLKSYFDVATLDGFATLERPELSVCAAIVRYLERTQVGRKAALNPPRQLTGHTVMAIDAATRANLELIRTLKGDAKGSLIATIDRTVTAPGRRRLAEQICGPLTDPVLINARLDAVERLVDKASLRDRLRDILKTVPDMARALSRIGLERGGPRDLAALRDGIAGARALGDLLKPDIIGDVADLAELAQTLRDADAVFEAELGAALIDTPPLLGRDGGFVRAGYRADLDELRSLRDESRRVIASMQNDYAETTDVKALKIKHNNVLGYFIEVTAQHGDKLFAHENFIHRQTMANAVRFTTVALGELESKIVSAGDKALVLELEVLSTLFEAAMTRADGIKTLADALATLDVFASHAELARSKGFSRPVVDGSLSFHIEGGRHPVVEAALERDGGGPFVANDCDLSPADDADTGAVWLLTGPNMGGKSTFLRQNALIAILAQAGSYVPAQSAHIGIVDRLFSRVGASDDLARGRSTFMVEMVETAAILNQASPASLVILDEIGRGTATFDGLSIAWASVEHLHDINKCRAVFATHFHELTVLATRLERVQNATVKVKEWDGDVIFLHEVGPGAADRSYGVQVAKLAGLPHSVVERARAVLDILEAGEREGGAKSVIDDLPLFSTPLPKPTAHNPAHDALKAQIDALLPDHMSPREALDALYALKAALKT